MKQKTSIFEWAGLFIFIILEIVVFYIRTISPEAELNQLSRVLFGTFEVLFSLYIGYFLQKIDSTKQFQESLKKYGLSAYRRIMDIKISINRTIAHIDKLGTALPKDKLSDVSALRSILESTLDTVDSSVLDWEDIIGTEIRKKEKAEQLQEELTRKEMKLHLSTEDTNRIDEIRSELKYLRSELPLSLKGVPSSYENRRMEFQNVYLSYLESSINRDKFLTLYIRLFPGFLPQQIAEMEGTQPLGIFIGKDGMGKFEGAILNREKNAIGIVVNPILSNETDIFYWVLEDAFRWLNNLARSDTSPYFFINEWKYGGITNDETMVILQIPVEAGYFPRG